MATWAVQSPCNVFLHGIDNDMSISATFRLLKAPISAFRVAAHIETIMQHIEAALKCVVLVRSSVHTLWDPFKDLGSDHRHRLQSKIISSLFGMHTHPLKHAEKKFLHIYRMLASSWFSC